MSIFLAYSCLLQGNKFLLHSHEDLKIFYFVL